MRLEHLLLGVLLMRPRTGYDLKRFMDLRGVFMRPRTQMSQVYRSLTQMAERGWVAFTVSHRPGAQDAKIFSATPSGQAEFMAWLESPYVPTVEPVNFEFRARLFFGSVLGYDSLIQLLDTEIDARQRQIAKYRFRDRTIDIDPGTPFDADLVAEIENFQHESGAAAMDAHVARTIELRELIRARRAASTTPA